MANLATSMTLMCALVLALVPFALSVILGRGTMTTADNTVTKECPVCENERGVSNLQHMDQTQILSLISAALSRLSELRNETVSENFALLKVPVSSVQSGLRQKRFVLSAISSVTAFLVKTGVWSLFKLSCASFVKTAGGLILGEIFQQSRRHQRYRRSYGTDRIPEYEIDAYDFVDGSDPCECVGNAVLKAPILDTALLYTPYYHNSYPFESYLYLGRHFKDLTSLNFDSWVYRFAPRANFSLNPLYGHRIDDEKCYFSSLACNVLMNLVAYRQSYVDGCGRFPAVQLELTLIYFEIKSQRHFDACQHLKTLSAHSEPVLNRKSHLDDSVQYTEYYNDLSSILSGYGVDAVQLVVDPTVRLSFNPLYKDL